ncbi:MAG TPA: hypothetical protein DDW50_17350 [Firmicutes bacterium]|nr:hypothetical protein [Bacillota bacterium]
MSDVDLIENKLRWDIPVGQKDSIFISLAGGYSSSDDLPLPQQFKLGGFFRLGAYYPDELSGSNYVFDNIGYLKCIGKLISGKNVYLGVWLENGGIYEKGSDLDIKSDLSIGFISSTILGPEFIGASYGENSRAVYYAGLGYYF